MNCDTFEASFTDLAREAPVDGTLRARLLEHSKTCGRCRAHLEAETALTAAFRLAAADSVAVPERIETALLAAYRGRHAATRRGVRQFPLRYVGIAAAILLALAGATAFVWLRSPHTAGLEIANSSVPRATQATSRAAGPAPVSVGGEAKTDSRGTVADPDPSKSAVERRVAARRAVLAEEFATDFIPLAYSSELSYLDSGQLIRVQLPRNAMASYGIPVNQELADRPVTAQVLIGQDGVARAIRFLSDPGTRLVPTKQQARR